METQKWLAPHQYSSCKGHTVHNAALNITLTHKYLLITCTNALEFNNDASACYDRIIPNLANLIVQQASLDPKIANLHGSVLLQAHYHLKTDKGISDGSYNHSDPNPVFGTGQGATHSPIMWAIISSVLFHIFH